MNDNFSEEINQTIFYGADTTRKDADWQ